MPLRLRLLCLSFVLLLVGSCQQEKPNKTPSQSQARRSLTFEQYLAQYPPKNLPYHVDAEAAQLSEEDKLSTIPKSALKNYLLGDTLKVFSYQTNSFEKKALEPGSEFVRNMGSCYYLAKPLRHGNYVGVVLRTLSPRANYDHLLVYDTAQKRYVDGLTVRMYLHTANQGGMKNVLNAYTIHPNRRISIHSYDEVSETFETFYWELGPKGQLREKKVVVNTLEKIQGHWQGQQRSFSVEDQTWRYANEQPRPELKISIRNNDPKHNGQPAPEGRFIWLEDVKEVQQVWEVVRATEDTLRLKKSHAQDTLTFTRQSAQP